MDHCLFQALRRWTIRRHPNKSHTWVNRKYWRLEKGAWSFGTREGMRLRAYAKTAIVRHTKVKEARSPGDGTGFTGYLIRPTSLPIGSAGFLNQKATG